MVDNGPDWNSDYIINFLKYGMLWKNSNLSTLILVSFAAGDSRMNMIERLWSFISDQVAGVRLPITLPGESEPPHKQNLSDEEKGEKIDQMFYNASEISCKYLRNKKYDGFQVKVHAEKGKGDKENEEHEKLKKYLNSMTKKNLSKNDNGGKKYKELRSSIQFLITHAIKSSNYLQFSQCKDQTCNHCSQLPIDKSNFRHDLDKLGGCIPVPEPSIIHPGHFKTLNEMLKQKNKNTKFHRPGNVFRKKCDFGCNYVMTSFADAERHYMFMGHSGKPKIEKRKRTLKPTKLKP